MIEVLTRRNFFGFVAGAPILAALPIVEKQNPLELFPAPLKTTLIEEVAPKHLYTPGQIAEFKRCVDDPIYFIENYVTDNGEKHMLYEWQKAAINQIEKRSVMGVMPRQSGKTFLEMGMMLHMLMFRPGTSIGLVSPKVASSIQILNTMKLAYEKLPTWLRSHPLQWNKQKVEFDNGNRLYVGSPWSFRGHAFSHLIIDEAAHMNRDTFEELMIISSVLMMSNGRIMMLSTPNGDNHFKAAYLRNSVRPKEWFTFQLAWYDIQDKQWNRDWIQSLHPMSGHYQQEFLARFVPLN